MTKMTDAFKKLFLGLGGDAKELAENNDVGDYIEDLEGAIKAYVDEAAGEGKELPTPAVGDIGKVVSVVSDGESGAEYSLETPAGGGTIGKYSLTVTCNNGVDIQVTLASGITRDNLCNPSSNYDINIGLSAYIFYISADYTVMSGVNLTLNNYVQATIQGSTKSLPVFTGILVSNNAGSTGSQGDLYQVIFILGATAAGDRLEVIKLTTT